MKRNILVLLVAAGAAWAASAWAAEDPVRLTRYPTGEVRPGEMFQLEWSNPSEDVEELEILLSLDGGRHYSLRITPEIDARTRRVMCRIPDAATEHARLRIRYGREHEEALGKPTPEFAIRSGGADSDSRTGRPPAEAPMVHEPGWWSSTDAQPPESSRGLSAGGAEISNAAAALPATESRRPDFERPAPAASIDALPERPLAAPAPNPTATIPSRFIPLRE